MKNFYIGVFVLLLGFISKVSLAMEKETAAVENALDKSLASVVQDSTIFFEGLNYGQRHKLILEGLGGYICDLSAHSFDKALQAARLGNTIASPVIRRVVFDLYVVLLRQNQAIADEVREIVRKELMINDHPLPKELYIELRKLGHKELENLLQEKLKKGTLSEVK